MPRPSNTEQRRREIVQGLAQVMAERGYAEASIRAIATAAGLTPGLVHYHFESKRQILVALIETLAHTVRARLRIAAAECDDPVQAAIDALVGTDAGADARAVACWVVVGAEAVREPVVRELYASAMERLIAEFEQILGDAMRKRGGPGALAASAAVAVVASIEGFFRLASGAPRCVPAGSASAAVRSIADGFVAADAGTR